MPDSIVNGFVSDIMHHWTTVIQWEMHDRSVRKLGTGYDGLKMQGSEWLMA
jgi:hypothetical protein